MSATCHVSNLSTCEKVKIYPEKTERNRERRVRLSEKRDNKEKNKARSNKFGGWEKRVRQKHHGDKDNRDRRDR